MSQHKSPKATSSTGGGRGPAHDTPSPASVRVPSAEGLDVHPITAGLDTCTDRRTFLTLMGAAAGLAGAGLGGCVRKPRERIVPFNRRPEDRIPGKPVYYATSAWIAGSVAGLLVESQDGRPTKVEGNPAHPVSNPLGGPLGRTDVWSQASVLDLYDPDRSDWVRHRGKASTATAFWKAWETLAADLRKRGGAGLALLLDGTPSPTLRRLVRVLRRDYPQAAVYVHDPGVPAAAAEGLALLGMPAGNLVYRLERAARLVAVDADPLGLEGERVRNAVGFAAARVREPDGDRRRAAMSRLYAVEPHFTATGLMADHRLRLSGRLCGDFLRALAAALEARGVTLGMAGIPPGAVAAFAAAAFEESGAPPERTRKWVTEIARDLQAHRGRSLVMVGHRQPAWAHGLAYAINAALGAVGPRGAVGFVPDPEAVPAGSLRDLAAALRAGRVETLVVLGPNPVYDAPADLDFRALYERVGTTVALTDRVDETAAVSTWHLPQTHFLEAWGDLRARDGTVSLQQPLIAPLRGGLSPIGFLAHWLEGGSTDHDAVRRTWRERLPAPSFSSTWQQWLHDGVTTAARPAVQGPTPDPRRLSEVLSRLEPIRAPRGIELVFSLDPSVYDGRFANNAWLQELPDTVTKLAWDNAALLSPSTARRLGVTSGERVRISVGQRSVVGTAHVVPGVAERSVVLPLGYGRTRAGRVARLGRGFDVGPVRTQQGLHYAEGGHVTRLGGTGDLVTTQPHGSMREPLTGKDRPVVRRLDLTTYRGPLFEAEWKRHQLIPDHLIRSLWTEPNPRDGHQWAMAIDLSRCIGCNVCTVACQAENAIPVVGKEEVRIGRELHWIRVDRYFTTSGPGDPEADPDAGLVCQPLPCQQCETAPCENVCPVGATLHSPEGLNDMAYNRCIGTRYCANNCPFKVRRFNFHNYNQRMEALVPEIALQRNPDVSVRFRGVMEKCTYCVQRIQEAKIAAKSDPRRRGRIRDGDIVPACMQACPTGAIVFGDLNDPESAVARLRRAARHYGLLEELNLHPRTTYLARLRNPNPRLA